MQLWLSANQDYLWFLVACGWGLAAFFWWRQRTLPEWAWVPWAALGGIGTAICEIGHLVIEVKLVPFMQGWIAWEVALSAVTALLAAGWGWTALAPLRRPARVAAASGIALVAAAAATFRASVPALAAPALTLLVLAAGIALLARPGRSRGSRLALAATTAAWLLTTHGWLSELLDQPHRLTELTVLGPWAALAQLIALGVLARQAAPVFLPDLVGDDPAERTAWRELLRHIALWLVVGVLLATVMGAWGRKQLQASLLARVRASASLIDRAALARALGPEFRIDQVTYHKPHLGRPAVQGHSDFLKSDVELPVSRNLDQVEDLNPDLRWANIITFRDGWWCAPINDTRIPFHPGNVNLLGKITPRVQQRWDERHTYVEGPHRMFYGDVMWAHAALTSPSGEMLGWLNFEVGATTWVAAQAQARLQAFAVVGLVCGLLVSGFLSRQRQRRHEAAHTASQIKTLFLAKVSHELRTPIQNVLGYCELLHSHLAQAEGRRWLEALHQQGHLMTRLVNDLIDLSAIEAGAFTLSPRPTAVVRVVEEVVESYRPRAAAKGLGLTATLASDVPPWLDADPERLRQLVSNLLGNAVKYTDHGRVEVDVQADAAAPDATGRVTVRLSVRDTGPGITAEEQARLLQPFYRVARTAEKEGHGLGLSLTAGICRAMGEGRLEIESDGRSGSCFTAVLRLLPVAAPVAPTGEPAVTSLAGREVLIVDDNPLMRELFATSLGARGARCTTATDLATGTPLATSRSFDTLVVDLSLPDGSGIELVRAVRAQPGKSSPPPWIVGLSAHAGAADREAGLAAGMNVFLSKPVPMSDLAQAVAGQIVGRRGGATLLDATPAALTLRLREGFLAEAATQRAALAAAVAARDWPAVVQRAHYLKNSALVVQDESLWVACEGLQSAAEVADEPQATGHWRQCDRRLAHWLQAE